MTYETPEVVLLGKATDVILGGCCANDDCCTCGLKNKQGDDDLIEGLE